MFYDKVLYLVINKFFVVGKLATGRRYYILTIPSVIVRCGEWYDGKQVVQILVEIMGRRL